MFKNKFLFILKREKYINKLIVFNIIYEDILKILTPD